jgi:hypothetical protein
VATQVSICSNALLMLGAKTISAIDEESDRAEIAANLYDSTRDAVLRSHPWNCAVKRVVLAPDSDAPVGDDYSAQFTLPGDFLRVLAVGESTEDVDYKIESGKILASGTSLFLRYIWKNTTESTWDPMLVKAMELQMSAAMAYAITMSAAKEQLQLEKLERFMKQCRAVDGQDDPPQQLGDERLLNARFGSVSYVPGR